MLSEMDWTFLNDKMFLILLRTRNHGDDVGKPGPTLKITPVMGSFSRIGSRQVLTRMYPAFRCTDGRNPMSKVSVITTFGSQNMSWGRPAKLNKNGDYWSDPNANRQHGDHWAEFGFIGTMGYDRGRDESRRSDDMLLARLAIRTSAVNVIADDKDTSAGTDDYAFSGDCQHQRNYV